MKAEKFSQWDVVDYLVDQEMIEMYLQEAFCSNNLQHIQRALIDARRAQKKLGLKPTISTSLTTVVDLAEKFGLQINFVSKSGEKLPKPCQLLSKRKIAFV